MLGRERLAEGGGGLGEPGNGAALLDATCRKGEMQGKDIWVPHPTKEQLITFLESENGPNLFSRSLTRRTAIDRTRSLFGTLEPEKHEMGLHASDRHARTHDTSTREMGRTH